MIRPIPNSFPICCMLVRRKHLMSSALPACFPEGSPNILSSTQKPPGSGAEDAEALKTGGMSWRCPHHNANNLPKVSRSSFPHPNFALDQNLDAENSPSPEGAETRGSVPGDKDSERNLSGICGQVAESCGFINFAFRILSRPCPGVLSFSRYHPGCNESCQNDNARCPKWWKFLSHHYVADYACFVIGTQWNIFKMKLCVKRKRFIWIKHKKSVGTSCRESASR